MGVSPGVPSSTSGSRCHRGRQLVGPQGRQGREGSSVQASRACPSCACLAATFCSLLAEAPQYPTSFDLGICSWPVNGQTVAPDCRLIITCAPNRRPKGPPIVGLTAGLRCLPPPAAQEGNDQATGDDHQGGQCGVGRGRDIHLSPKLSLQVLDRSPLQLIT